MSGLRVEAGKKATRYLYARAVIDKAGSAEFLPGTIVTTTDPVGTGQDDAEDTYTFTVVGHDGRTTAEQAVQFSPPTCGWGSNPGLYVVSAFVPLADEDDAAILIVSKDGDKLASVPLDAAPPTVVFDKVPPPGSTAEGRQDLTWSSASADGSPVSHSVWYTNDEGVTWWPLSVATEAGGVTVDFDRLPSGKAARLRITAVSGAAVTEGFSEPFVVKTRPVQVEVVLPGEHASAAPGALLPVLAAAWRVGDGPVDDPLAYRWSSDLDGDLGIGPDRNVVLVREGKHLVTVTVSTGDTSIVESRSVGVVRDATRFLHVADPSSIDRNRTWLRHDALDDHADAVLLITPLWDPPGGPGVYNDCAVGVWFDGKHWTIFNEDLSPMPEGAAFIVDVMVPGPTAFVDSAVPNGNSTYLSHPLADGRPEMLLLLTRNANPGEQPAVTNPSPTGAWFDATAGRWAIFNQDLNLMPPGAAHNVEIAAPGDTAFVHIAAEGNLWANSTRLSHRALDGNRDALVQVTPLWNPSGGPGVYLPHHHGVWYDGEHWNVFTQSQRPIPPGAGFAVLLK